jgi:hypothetical protein
METSYVSPEKYVHLHISNRNSYTKDHITAVEPAHRKPDTWQDRVALQKVRFLRWGMDFATGYRSSGPTTMPNESMTEEKWLRRFVFLESVAGVPGMVAGMLRHLKSLRQMRRDNGWQGIPEIYKRKYCSWILTKVTRIKLSSKKPTMSECIS